MKSYSKIKDIGTGSYGKAVLVKNTENAKFVIKKINIAPLSSKEKKDAINEVQVLSTLRHPYIVQYMESFIEDGVLCIVMDYCENGDLFNLIQKTRRAKLNFSENQIIRWFTQMALAIKYMHEHHVLHRDLKSQNLFLKGPTGRLKIGDFGIAKVLDSTTALAKTVIGSPYYMSPEICEHKPYSWSSDVWAMGCMLYEMCALRVPFEANDINELVKKITRSPPPHIPHYSKELCALGIELLDNAEGRRPTASEIVRRPLVQQEIRKMFQEENERRQAALKTPAPPQPQHPYMPIHPSEENLPPKITPLQPEMQNNNNNTENSMGSRAQRDQNLLPRDGQYSKMNTKEERNNTKDKSFQSQMSSISSPLPRPAPAASLG